MVILKNKASLILIAQLVMFESQNMVIDELNAFIE